MSAAGTDLSATLINCFVQPVGDSIATAEDGVPGIYTALTEAAETMRRVAAWAGDFSASARRRPGWERHAQPCLGPGQLYAVFDRSCETVESAGSRRGGADGRAAHRPPDIEAFIHAPRTRAT